MKITFISDTHGKHDQLVLPETDLLIHAGDLSSRGTLPEIQQFLDWFAALPIKHKVFIGGNHDFLLEQSSSMFRSMLTDDYIYLENSSVEIEGIKIWGSPITPWFFDWAFNRERGEEIAKYWDMIPEDTDILVTHGPPFNFGDLTERDQQHVGCADLLAAVQKINPRYHIFGHIHEAQGIYKTPKTTFINASVLNLKYEMVNEPVSVMV